MKTVIFEVRSLEDCLDDFSQAWDTGVPQTSARMAFVTQELMDEILTPDRRSIVRILCGAGEVTATETARRMGRDADEVEADFRALVLAGILEPCGEGRVIFPYDEVILDLPMAGRTTV